MIGIYKITNPKNKIYIGQSINIEKRFKAYNHRLPKSQTKLYNSLKKYGIKNHKFETLLICELSELNEMERYYQDLYSATGIDGLNIIKTSCYTRSGEHSIETKQKIRNSLIGKKRPKHIGENLRRLYTGRKLLASHIEAMKRNCGKANLGKHLSLETKNKISNNSKMARVIIDTATGETYKSIRLAAEATNIKYGRLRYYLRPTSTNKTTLIYK